MIPNFFFSFDPICSRQVTTPFDHVSFCILELDIIWNDERNSSLISVRSRNESLFSDDAIDKKDTNTYSTSFSNNQRKTQIFDDVLCEEQNAN